MSTGTTTTTGTPRVWRPAALLGNLLVISVFPVVAWLIHLHFASPTPAPQGVSIQVSNPSSVRLHLAGGPFDSVAWDIVGIADPAAEVAKVVSPDGADCEVSGPPGVHRAVALTVKGGRVAIARATYTVPGTKPAPGPVDPPPGPDQPAARISDGFFAIGVFEFTKNLTLPGAQQAIFASTTLPAEVSGLGGSWFKFDVNDSAPGVANSRWMAAAKLHGVPALVLTNRDGSVYSGQPMPSDEAGVISAVKTALGRH